MGEIGQMGVMTMTGYVRVVVLTEIIEEMFSAVRLFSNVVFPSVFLDISRNACEKYKDGLLNIK